MKIFNEEYFEKIKKIRDDNNLQDELTEQDCICYANMFYVFNDITSNKYSFEEMFQIYDFITDVIDGLRPDIMIKMTDKYRDIYRLLTSFSVSKKLDDETRKKLAFLIYQAKCVVIIDKKTMQPTWNMEIFAKGTKSFLNEYEYEIKEYPNTYEIKKPLSNPLRDDFGLSPNNPIELVSIGAEYEYLAMLLTKDGEKINYENIGCITHEDGETIIDMYNIYSIKNKKIATLYITGYGNENVIVAPKGFKLML